MVFATLSLVSAPAKFMTAVNMIATVGVITLVDMEVAIALAVS